jgi:hypothetical protein
MYVWDVVMDKSVTLKRVGGGGVSLVTWSPDGSKVFAATTGIIFRSEVDALYILVFSLNTVYKMTI